MLIESILKIFNDDREPHFKLFTNITEEEADSDRISEVITWARDEGYLERLDISEDSAEVLLRSMLIEHNLPEELRNNEQIRDELKQVAIDKAGEGSPLSPEEAERVHTLIASGEVFRDIFYMLNVIFGLITKPDRFSNLDDSFEAYIGTLIALPESIIKDLDPRDAFEKISNQIDQIKRREPPEDLEILNNTMKTIYSTPEVGEMIDVTSALLAPENESLRIALLIYARLNGINLEMQDIDKVRDTILVKDNPKLGSLFSYLLIPDNAMRLAGG